MKKFFVAAVSLAAWVSAGFGGVGVNWTAGGRVYAYGEDPNNEDGRGIAEDNNVVWQLVYAGPDNVANEPDLNNTWRWVSGDDVVLAQREIPAGGGLASDGTEWDVYLAKMGGNSVYVNLDWVGEGYVFQRIYQGEPSPDCEVYYFESSLFQFRTDYSGGPYFPDMFGASNGEGVCVDRMVPPPLAYYFLWLYEYERTFTAAATNGAQLEVRANVSWSVTSSASWLTLRTENGWGDGTIVYDVAANTGENARTATITVRSDWDWTETTFSVTQLSGVVKLELAAVSRTFTADAARGNELGVAANMNWTAESANAWLTVQTRSGTGDGTIVYDIAANMATNPRVGTITVAGAGLTRTFRVEQGGAAPLLTLASESRSFAATAAGGNELGVTANVPWTAASSASWVLIKTGSGTGDGKIVYDVSANTGEEARTATITVTGGGLARTFTVSQAGVVLTLGSNSRSFTADAASGQTLGVTANVPWTAGSSVAWLTVKTTSGSGNGSIAYDVAANMGSDDRTGSIMVMGGGLVRTFTVTQGGLIPALELAASSRRFTEDAASNQELGVTANVAWTAVSSETWLTVQTPGGTGNGIILYDVAENTATSDRTATITVTGGGLVRTFTVTQDALIPVLALAASSRSFTADAASNQELGVSANVAWKAVSSEAWLTVQTPGGTGNGTILYDVAENTATSDRTGTVTVTGGGLARTFTVTQDGVPPALALAESSRSFTAVAASGQELGVTANVPWTAESSVEWLTVKTAAGSGDGTILYDVAANDGTETRTGTITVAGGGISRTFTVSQDSPWSYEVSGGQATVTGVNPAEGSLVIPSSLGGYPVTGIGNGAFSGCSGLSAVTIPAGVTRIGESAFAGCSGLAAVAIPGSVTNIGANAFAGCAALKTASVPQCVCSGRMADVFPDAFAGIETVSVCDGVTEIAAGAFAGCSALSSVTFPEGLARIEDGAFVGCESLAWMEIPESLADWGPRAFPDAMLERLEPDAAGLLVHGGWVLGHRNREVGTITVPDGVVGIGNHALANFYKLETVGMPDSLKYIGRGAFETNTQLDKLVIPDGVEWVRDGAFQRCTYLRALSIGVSVAHIGREAFAECTQLSTVELPDSVVSIGDCAFSNCWRMLSVKVSLGLEEAGTDIFADCESLKGVTMPAHAFTAARLFEDCYGALESVTITEGETVVGSATFLGCTNLSSVVLPEGVEKIGTSAFSGCSSLADLELPGTLVDIGSAAFEGCNGLKTVVLPDSVEKLGAKAFRNCPSLENVTLSRSLGTVPDRAFEGCPSLSSMVVPASVTNLGARIGGAFTALYFLGDAPACDANAYAAIPSGTAFTTYVVQRSHGWDGIPTSMDLPKSWLGFPIAFWAPNRFDAFFDANGGQFPDGSQVYAREQITGVAYELPPYPPTKDGADFDGWWTAPVAGAQITATTQVNETREITFYAHWKVAPEQVTVRFNANGGTVAPAEETFRASQPYGELPIPVRVHYRFDGWWTAQSGGNKIVASSRVPGADQELFAHWTPETYTIRFHSNGGGGTMADQLFTYGSSLTLRANAFEREGWTFAGWALSENGPAVYADRAVFSEVSSVQDGIIHLYAAWSSGRYVVRFDANGGTGRMDNQTLRVGIEQALSRNQFSRGKFRFLGWARTPLGGLVWPDGARVRDLTTVPDETVVLYAVWELPEITDDSEVADVLAGSSDQRLAKKLASAKTYTEFRDWAVDVKGGDGTAASANAVLESSHAWASYLLGAEALFENEPTIQIDGIAMQGSTGKKASAATMTVRISVRDGSDVSSVDPAKVAALFVATSDLHDWTGSFIPDARLVEKDGEGFMSFTIQAGGEGESRMFLGIREQR